MSGSSTSPPPRWPGWASWTAWRRRARRSGALPPTWPGVGPPRAPVVETARPYADVIVSDEGRGLPAARSIGARTATTPLVALVDADVILPAGSLAAPPAGVR